MAALLTTPSSPIPVMDADALNAFLTEAFPFASPENRGQVIAVSPGSVRMQLYTGEAALRPGSLVSGPVQMALVDTVAYALVLAHVGPVSMAVTSSLNMQFLRGCSPGRLVADAVLLRLGRRLVTLDVRLWTETADRLVAQAIVVYALPSPPEAPAV